MKPAAVVIPAYNEAERIGEVISAAQCADPELVLTDNIIVVDNYSSDGTAKVARAAGAGTIVVCGQVGKGYAMRAGFEYAQEKTTAGPVVFLDADLQGLRGEHVSELAEPVIDGQALMTIGYLGGRKEFAKPVYRYWGALSGQRCVSPASFKALRRPDFIGWRIEGALNAVHRNAGLGEAIQRLELDGVTHVGQFEKAATRMDGTVNYARIYLSGLRGLMSCSSL